MLAVISDVHANVAAFEAVLRDIDRHDVRQICCLGDSVGYNADPGSVIGLLRKNSIVTIKGNHDMMAAGELPIENCGENARISQYWTRSVLSPDELAWLRSLPGEAKIGKNILLVHSRLHDPVGYMVGTLAFQHQRQRISAHDPEVRICFTGHTHRPGLVEIGEDGVRTIAGAKTARVDSRGFCFINPGSVGHPRGSDYRASYVLFDEDAGTVEWRRVAYERERTLAGNRRNGIRTDLGPSVFTHTLRCWASGWRNRLGDRA